MQRQASNGLTVRFNPWWCCDEVSEACDHCYARTLAARFGWAWGAPAPRRFFGPDHWREPLRWNAKAEKSGERKRVFCASMADVFEILQPMHPQHGEMDTARADLWKLIEATPALDWQLLTKRPKNILPLVPRHWREDGLPANVWVGTTVENQEWAEKRIPYLLRVPARVRFLSCEPLLGPIEFSDVTRRSDAVSQLGKQALAGIHWVIAGGESGHGARPSHPDWFRSLRDQCQAVRVPFFFKQWGSYGPVWTDPSPVTRVAGEDIIGLGLIGKKAAGRTLDRREWSEFPEVAA